MGSGVENRYLSKSVNSFLSPFAHLFTRYPQRFHRIVPAAIAASGEFRLASAAGYLLSSLSGPVFPASSDDANPLDGLPSHRRVVPLAPPRGAPRTAARGPF